MKGTYAWMAPEIMAGKKATEKADLFSLYVVIWEVLTCEEPFSDCTDAVLLINLVENKVRKMISCLEFAADVANEGDDQDKLELMLI